MTTPSTPATILVVDDDPGLTRLIERELRREGYHTASVGSGEEAIDWLTHNVAHLVLLDLKLPGLRGNDLIDRLDGFHDHLPFIIITGQGDERVAVEMMKRGALDYLVKDVNFITMVPTVVQRALARLEEQARLSAAEEALARSHAELERRVTERTAELTQTNEALLESRMAALNLMEDAIAAREEAEQAEVALRESEESFRSFFENAAVGTSQLDVTGHFIRVNDRYCAITGYSREELLAGMGWLDLVCPEDREADEVQLSRFLRGETLRYHAEKRYLRKDGAVVWVNVSASTVRDAEGTLLHAVAVIEDITERKLAEEELRQARRFAESTLEAVPASLAVLDSDGVILSTNQAWTAFAEANGGAINAGGVGINYLDVCDAAAGDGVEESARFAAGIREVMRGEIPRFSMEYACHSPDQQRWFVGYVTPFTGNGPRSVVVAHVDVSERKRAEQVVRRLNNELEMRVEQRTTELRSTNEGLREEIAKRRRLEAEILHISEREQQRIGEDLHDDLGQRLAGTWMLSDALKKTLTNQGLPEAADAAKISTLLKDSLALTRALARGLHPVAIGHGGLVVALDELTSRICDTFHVNCRCQCPPAIELDTTTALHLYRIAQEAVTNAVKHGEAKEIHIELSTNPHHTILSVKDDGRGLPVPAPKSAGMGLHIMKYRTDMIGGVLALQNNPDSHGTIVTCTMPTPASDEPPTEPTYEQKSIPPAGKRAAKKGLHRR